MIHFVLPDFYFFHKINTYISTIVRKYPEKLKSN